MPDSLLPVAITSATQSNLRALLETLRGCWKASSLLWMQANGFPVLPGVIVDRWTPQAESAVVRFCEHGRFTELLLRIEKPGQRWTTRRGGYTIPASTVGAAVSELAEAGMLSLLLEPAKPYSDVYSLAAVCDLRDGVADVEIVGPGFDASDILRADIAPHEQLEVFFDVGTSVNVAPRIAKRRLVDSGGYLTSVQRRLIKIGAALHGSASPAGIPDRGREQFAVEAASYLRSTGQTLLLEHADRYECVPEDLLAEFLSELARLCRAMRSARVQWETLSLGSSFLAGARLVIWDFFIPDNYETVRLASITGGE